ncbi:MAG: hypothetical protein V7767_08380 [Leeuwenhoekiella sp.]
MKRFFYLLLIITTFSCSDEIIDEQPIVAEFITSNSLRTTFESLRGSDSPILPTTRDVKSADQTDQLCFQFVYPISLKYNDDSTVEIQDFETLLQVVLNETVNYHITAIGFPFKVTSNIDMTTHTIDTESQFTNLIEDCNYDKLKPVDVLNFVGNCFIVNYPISLAINDTVITFSNEDEIIAYFSNTTDSLESFNFSYPISVKITESGTDLEIYDDYEVIDLITNTCSIN